MSHLEDAHSYSSDKKETPASDHRGFIMNKNDFDVKF
jgi:hypothetical protein